MIFNDLSERGLAKSETPRNTSIQITKLSSESGEGPSQESSTGKITN